VTLIAIVRNHILQSRGVFRGESYRKTTVSSAVHTFQKQLSPTWRPGCSNPQADQQPLTLAGRRARRRACPVHDHDRQHYRPFGVLDKRTVMWGLELALHSRIHPVMPRRRSGLAAIPICSGIAIGVLASAALPAKPSSRRIPELHATGECL
jgi:hypothetical protein